MQRIITTTVVLLGFALGLAACGEEGLPKDRPAGDSGAGDSGDVVPGDADGDDAGDEGGFILNVTFI